MRRKVRGLLGLLLISIAIIFLIPAVNVDIPLSIKNTYPVSKCYTDTNTNLTTCIVEYIDAPSVVIIPLNIALLIALVVVILIGLIRIIT